MNVEFANPIYSLAAIAGFVAYVLGGARFRHWAVAGRVGKPRFPQTIETVLLWVVYSLSISFVIVGVLQLLRDR